MKQRFRGYYLKHQKGEHTLCMIIGQAGNERFIQVITEKAAWQLPWTGKCSWGRKGLKVDLEDEHFSLMGHLTYGNFTSLKYDIMGIFRYVPTECRHGVISMNHEINGQLALNGEVLDFNKGRGYIEMDSGTSFPSEYMWIQANDFKENTSIMAAVADIPFAVGSFRGCICVIHYRGKEYRLATYCGVQIVSCSKRRLVLRQRRYRLEIYIHGSSGNRLRAPQNGAMCRTIEESAACRADFIFYDRGKKVFELHSEHASFEFEARL